MSDSRHNTISLSSSGSQVYNSHIKAGPKIRDLLALGFFDEQISHVLWKPPTIVPAPLMTPTHKHFDRIFFCTLRKAHKCKTENSGSSPGWALRLIIRVG